MIDRALSHGKPQMWVPLFSSTVVFVPTLTSTSTAESLRRSTLQVTNILGSSVAANVRPVYRLASRLTGPVHAQLPRIDSKHTSPGVSNNEAHPCCFGIYSRQRHVEFCLWRFDMIIGRSSGDPSAVLIISPSSSNATARSEDCRYTSSDDNEQRVGSIGASKVGMGVGQAFACGFYLASR